MSSNGRVLRERGQSWQSLAWAEGRWRVLYGIARPQEKGALASALAEHLGQQQLRATSPASSQQPKASKQQPDSRQQEQQQEK